MCATRMSAPSEFFDANHLHDSEFGHAHKHFHSLIDQYDCNPVAWERAAKELWRTLQVAIRQDTAEADRTDETAKLEPTILCAAHIEVRRTA